MKASTLITFPLRYLGFLAGRMKPLWVTFGINENCNARCEYCSYWKERDPDLSTAEALVVLGKLRQMGAASVVFSGGEVLLRKDMVEVVAEAARLGLEPTIVTNGTIERKGEFEALMAHGLKGLAFSLDGSTAPVHESYRKGCAFPKVVNSIRSAVEIRKRHGFSLRISTTTVVHSGNLDDLEAISDLRKSLGADKNYFQPVWPLFRENGGGEPYALAAGLGSGGFEGLSRRLAAIPDGNMDAYYEVMPHLYGDFQRVTENYKCFAGRAFVYVNSRGELFPCSPLSEEPPLGSLLHESVEELRAKPDLQKRFDYYEAFECGGCTMACYMEKNAVLSKPTNPMSLWRRMR